VKYGFPSLQHVAELEPRFIERQFKRTRTVSAKAVEHAPGEPAANIRRGASLRQLSLDASIADLIVVTTSGLPMLAASSCFATVDSSSSAHFNSG
jgi:hypothetical protein